MFEFYKRGFSERHYEEECAHTSPVELIARPIEEHRTTVRALWDGGITETS